ncbi:RagB/SusD family nutrient uptake outer membrane protein [Flavivirga spongiicola]|uniref:RagB/SusD family nutrient uptake outer membrane protein n=1 Tax=Flavivirga spongiicola TaxID=421621 RepID=A0ABU7XN39_9FLAO|nr:RagB/SusD family nutrient uptake outer membrane protein [Flavivirga sp. MEBiC05379]MDO5981821.1 RagB/SusD family nutrient uptake outer membrane protein [Flavivirga sp. MEBiC05379]
MMKKINYILLLLINVVATSCDLDRGPFTEISAEQLFSDPGAAQAATLGNYLFLKGDEGFNGWSDDLHRMSEYSGDNVMITGGTTDALFFFYNYQRVATNGRSNRFWGNSYKAIVGVNTVLELLEEGTPEANQVLGENYYIRALVYFQMGNIYGKPYNQGVSNLSVPLKLTADLNDIPDRNTVGEVYDQVIADLLKAEELMNENKGPSFASKEAAQALLSRVYLYMGDNAKAIEYADKVINSSVYSLLSSERFAKMNELAPFENEEAIFSITLTKGIDIAGGGGFPDDWNTIGSFYAKIDGVGWGEMSASKTYLDLLAKNEGDLRGSFIEPQYLEDDNGQKIPAVNWVVGSDQNGYDYEFARTTDNGGTITFDYEGNNYTLESEVVGGRTAYYFNGPNGRQDVTFDFDMNKRNGFPFFYILKASYQEQDLHLWSPTVSRLAELYLNKAEALAKQGADQAALDNINVLRNRAQVPPYTLATLPVGQTVLDVVLEERQLELAFEGHRKFDVFRNGRIMNRRYPGTHLDNSNPFPEIDATNNAIIEFIPEQQILLQPSLIQND